MRARPQHSLQPHVTLLYKGWSEKLKSVYGHLCFLETLHKEGLTLGNWKIFLEATTTDYFILSISM